MGSSAAQASRRMARLRRQIASAGVDHCIERSADVVPLEVGQLQQGGLFLPGDLDRVRDLFRQSPRARHLLVSPEDGQMQSQLCGLTRFERNRMPLVDLEGNLSHERQAAYRERGDRSLIVFT
jgi:hypothetical protein